MTMTALAGRIFARLLRTRWLMRLPIWGYRCGLGWLLGSRFVMIEHLGRTSHLPRFVIVEVLQRGPGQIVVASGFGSRAQWYKNLRANGVAYLSSGLLRRAPARPRFMGTEESQVTLERYGAAHPFAYRVLREAMEILQGSEPKIPLIEFAPATANR